MATTDAVLGELAKFPFWISTQFCAVQYWAVFGSIGQYCSAVLGQVLYSGSTRDGYAGKGSIKNDGKVQVQTMGPEDRCHY